MTLSPSAVYAGAVAEFATRADWAGARWAARQAILARVCELLDEGRHVEIPREHPLDRQRIDVAERPVGRLVGAERCSP